MADIREQVETIYQQVQTLESQITELVSQLRATEKPEPEALELEPEPEPALEPEPELLPKNRSRQRPKKLDNIRIPWNEPHYYRTRRKAGRQVRSLPFPADCAKPDPLGAAICRELRLPLDTKRVRVHWHGDYYHKVIVDYGEWVHELLVKREALRPEDITGGSEDAVAGNYITFEIGKSWRSSQPVQTSPARGEVVQLDFGLAAKERTE